MMSVGDEALWSEGEIKAILQHQLDAPLEFDLSRLEHAEASLAGLRGGSIRTFRELLAHARPPLALLELTRRFAKTCRSQPEGPVPDEVSTVLYLAAIAAARLAWGQRISRLDDSAFRHALDWALEQSWLDAGVGDLLARARAGLTPSEPGTHA